MGDWQIAVRSSTAAADELLRRAFAAFLVEDARPERGYYSVVLGPTVASKAGERALSILFAGGVPIVRSRSSRRVLLALAAHLASYGAGPAPAGLLRLKAVAAVGERCGVLLPAGVFGHFDLCRLERELTRMSLRLVDQPWVQVDPVTAELVVQSAPLAADADAWPGEPEEAGPSGRFPLTGWFIARHGAAAGEPTLLEAVAHGVTLLRGFGPEGAQWAAESVALLAASCRLLPFNASSMDEALSVLETSLASH